MWFLFGLALIILGLLSCGIAFGNSNIEAPSSDASYQYLWYPGLILLCVGPAIWLLRVIYIIITALAGLD